MFIKLKPISKPLINWLLANKTKTNTQALSTDAYANNHFTESRGAGSDGFVEPGSGAARPGRFSASG